MPTDNEWEQRVLDRQTGYTPPIPAGDQPEPRREDDLREAYTLHREAWHTKRGTLERTYGDCVGGCFADIAARLAPTPEAAGLLPDEDEPYRDRVDSDLTIGEVNVRAGWRMAREQVRSATPSQADRGLDAATTEYLAWAEADVPPDRTFEDWHDKGTVLLRNLAVRLQDSIPDSSSQETE